MSTLLTWWLHSPRIQGCPCVPCAEESEGRASVARSNSKFAFLSIHLISSVMNDLKTRLQKRVKFYEAKEKKCRWRKKNGQGNLVQILRWFMCASKFEKHWSRTHHSFTKQFRQNIMLMESLVFRFCTQWLRNLRGCWKRPGASWTWVERTG